MRRDRSLPTYEQLFGALDFRKLDDSRSVYSPAAYLADLLQLLDDNFEQPALTSPDRRSDITGIPLDAENTYTELPYLDIVNKVLATLIPPDAHQELKEVRFPFTMPFALDRAQVQRYLHHFGVGPVELYELFAERVDRDTIAREYLGLSTVDVAIVTTVLTDHDDLLKTYYGVDPKASFAQLHDVGRFARSTRLSAAELDELLSLDNAAADPSGTTLVWGHGSAPIPPEWFERVNRFVRLADRIGLSLTDTDVVLRSCCENRIDLEALRTIAVVLHLHRSMELPVDVICSLVGPIDAGLFHRVFNEPFAKAEQAVIPATGDLPPAYRDMRLLTVAGDLLAPVNKEYRARVARAVDLSESDIVAVVTRFRKRLPASGVTLDLLHRIGRLTGALDITVADLFAILDALDADRALRHNRPFGGLIDVEPSTLDHYRMLDAADAESGLCLVQLLVGVVRWMQANGIESTDLGGFLGGVVGDVEERETEERDAVLRGLREEFAQVGPTPDLFVSERFSERASRVVRDVTTEHETTAYDALTALAAITEADFQGLGLVEQLPTKIFTNLVLRGYLDAEGTLVEGALPPTAAAFELSTDFAALRVPLFALIGGLCDADPDAQAFYPSDLATLGGLTDAQQAELYDNLVVNGYVDASGEVLRPEFFADAENEAAFAVSVPMSDVAPAVFARLRALVERFRSEPIPLDPEIFADIRLTEQQRPDLVESLRFNGYVDKAGNYVDTPAIARLTVDGIGLAVQFHPHRQPILEAVQAQIAGVRAEVLTVDAESLHDIADQATSRAVAVALHGTYLVDNLVPDESRPFFADPDSVLTLAGVTRADMLAATDPATVTRRISAILAEQQAYQLDLAELAALGFDDDETTRLIDVLIAAEYIDEELAIPEDRLAWFAAPTNALAFTLAGLEDFSTDIFFLLHTVARELTAGIVEITDTLAAQADRQRSALVAVLQDALGLPAATVEAICEGAAGSIADAFAVLVTPGPAAARAYDRIQRFARFTAKLGLDATQVGVAFHDQDLAGKFPEPLVLPPDVDRIDALLETADGSRYLFRDATYWIYPAATAAAGQPKPLSELSPRFAGLTGVDAAFTDAAGTDWVIGHDTAGSHAFVRLPDTGYWTRKDQIWGTVRSTFSDPSRIDSAFVDDEGVTFLFCGDQYVRYSTSDYTHVDEGYPRAIGGWWEAEGRRTPLPARFRGSIEASFQDRDGTTHLFAGGRCLAVGNGATDRPIGEVWGRVRNNLAETGRVDAAYTESSSTVLLSGNQVVRYSDCIENDGVRVDEGYPSWIESQLPDVPVGFDGALEAAFVDAAGVVHLFKDGRTVALTPGAGARGEVVPIAERWGLIGPVLRDDAVDSAFVGLDGKTYLFSGDRYVRYSGADYSAVDLGYPRAIARDWGGLQRVDASFVLDGATYLFGTVDATGPQQYVRYSTRNYTTPDPGFPKPLTENWWNLPDTAFSSVDAVFTGRDNRTYLFSGGQYVVFDNKHRWWSEPRVLRRQWDSLPFEWVDAAFVGKDGKTYVFSGQQFVRYTGADYTKLDDRYPAPISTFWGNVVNNIARHGRVDAALTLDTSTFLFSGDQYVRYEGTDLGTVADGYPRSLDALTQEPRFRNLPSPLTGRVDAAFADRRNAYLFVDGRCHVVSDTAYRRYDQLGYASLGCAFVEDGAVLVEEAGGWQHYSALEGVTVAKTTVRPRTLRTVPVGFRRGLDAVLRGADGKTYLFKGGSCFDVTLNREYPLAEDWGRPRNTIQNDNIVDAAFVGRDGRTYVFSGDQFVVYTGARVVDADITGEPRSIAAHWGGLTSVTLAYVRAGLTYLFEKPDATGAVRYVVYSGTDYARPDAGYPQTVDADFWGVPDDYRPTGFTVPDAVVIEGENMVLLVGAQYLRFHEPTGAWSPPRPISRLWPGIDREGPVTPTAAFTGPDAATHVFFPSQFTSYSFTSTSGGGLAPRRPIRDAWGRSRNNFVAAGGRVDAAVVDGDGRTFLFSGDQYVRYTSADYRHVDPGYPKAIGGNLRTEAAFANLPDAFEDAIAERTGPVIDAVVANRRTMYLFVGADVHVVSRALAATFDVSTLGKVRNTVAERGTVDAALVTDGHTFLFSGDQYIRYSGLDHAFVDDGYPRSIAASLHADLKVREVPEELHDGIDAAIRGTDGGTYLFAGRSYLRAGAAGARPIKDAWGRVRNAFTADAGTSTGLDAAFAAPTGELYVFRGGQFARYSGGDHTFVDDGFPRTITDDWGDLPQAFEEAGIDAAFVLEGRTYLGCGEEYVRYSGDGYREIDRTYPQTFRQRWSGGADYLLDDLRIITRFAELTRAHDGLADFVAAGPGTVADPYAYLSTAFGWDVGELRWLVRHHGFLDGSAEPGGDRVELELLLRLVDVFAVADKFGTGPSMIFTDVWSRLHGDDLAAGDSAADTAKALYGMLMRRTGLQDRAVLSRQVHDELNVLERDALVSVVLARTGAVSSRDLYEQLLIDVDMGSRGVTSPVREAIAATQLFLHRWFLGLEDLTAKGNGAGGADEDAARQRMRTWWAWMRNYRTWEANRKVFLYPENYIRPELRKAKTPAFQALENDLLQGEITPESVERAYKRYLDEYTEVSRLAIAGGYVYTAGARNTRDLVLFGRTRTQPRRYYYRRAQFRSQEKLTAAWEPWLKVDVQIDADEVQPVHAFGRVFVFWTTIESVAPAATSSTTLVAKKQGDAQEVSAPPTTERVKIHYSFYNLNKEWIPAQTLAMDTRRPGSIFDVELSVEVMEADEEVPESIVVSCTYSVITTKGTAVERATYTQVTALTPELVEEALDTPRRALSSGAAATVAVPAATNPLEDVFTADEIAAVAAMDVANLPRVVRFNSPTGSTYGPWFSIDHKGGSFLCRPAVVAPADAPSPAPLAGNALGLPEWERIDAAFEAPDGTRTFFGEGRFVTSTKGKLGTEGWIADRWGRAGNNLTRNGVVDAVLHRGEHTYVFSGSQYFRFSGDPFGPVDTDYPMDIAANTDGFPRWPSIDAAFTDLDGTEWFYSAQTDRIVQGGNLESETVAAAVGRKPLVGAHLPFGTGRVEAVLVDAERQYTYLFSGDQYARYSGRTFRAFDEGYPLPLADNDDGLPRQFRVGAALRLRGVSWFFDNSAQTYIEIAVPPADGGPPAAGRRGRGAPARAAEKVHQTGELGATAITGFATVDAAYVQGRALYLTSGERFARYTLPEKGPIPGLVDDGYPKDMPQGIDAVLRRGVHRYAFSGSTYVRMRPAQEPGDLAGFASVEGKWGELPDGFPGELAGVLDSDADRYLYVFIGPNYLRYPAATIPRPFERAALPLELVRLTTSTAAQLNQKLLRGGVAALLEPASQEIDEVPAFRTDRSTRNTIQVRDDRVEPTRLPASAHLDFQSANGIYYWEIFFHAPVLIAQALNDAQRFADAKQWYEFVFDPTERDRYWRFLPFLAVDLAALAERCRLDMAELGKQVTDAEFGDTSGLAAELAPVLQGLAELAPAFRQNRPLEAPELATLDSLASSRLSTVLADAVAATEAMLTKRVREPKRTAVRRVVEAMRQLQERTALVAGLRRQYDFVGDRDSLIDAYRRDPFDPHAISGLRPVGYRRAVVMAYIDNLLDWGDMLFRQYTGESIDEARMLYIFAWDLLGLRPAILGKRPLTPTQTYHDLDADPELDLMLELTSGGTMLEGAGAVHAGLANRYFRVPQNSAFAEYWERVEDRLRKIRQSLNILGISQPLPLFEPPIDPMALVRAVAGGVDVGAALSAAPVPVPHYRFDATFRRAQELVDKLRQFGNDLLSVLDRRDSEELSLLQSRQEGVILSMTRAIKDAQVQAAEANLRELEAGRGAADQRIARYKRLIENGLSATEQAQIGMMATASALHLAAGLIKIGSGIAYALPQNKIGPFIIGVEWGGKQLGAVLDKAAEIPQVVGEGFSITGELLGVRAEHDRSNEEWQFQLATAESDLTQIKHQVTAAEHQVAVARREAEILGQEIAHNEAVATFLKDKFGNAQLYQWMSGQLSGLYFQAYNLAYDVARSAERAFRFERGMNDAEVTFIRPLYWDSRRGGLLAGESLGIDLERLGRAYLDTNSRALEITKRVSLMELDPVAMLRLPSTGACEFALTEELFDRDFPGHFRRQIRAVAVAFDGADGQPVELNATLTQVGHKTVLAADPKAVKHLLDPKETPPETVRSDWRANQQIALSHVGEQENNGLFELRYDDTRYLPFEGTGAVSTWRLELNGRRPAQLRNATVTVRYAAEQGGETFANAVKGMLKPYAAARFFDVATEFPQEWQEFIEGDTRELTLPFTPDMFPGMDNRRITGVYPRYELVNGSAAKLVLNGDRTLALDDGKVLSAPALTVAGDGSGWVFVLDGDKEALGNVGLVLTYRAGVA